MLGKLKDSANAAKKQAEEASGGIKEKIQSVLAEFNEAIPAIKEVGYTVSEVEIEMGLPPKIKPHFMKEKEVDEETSSKVLEKYKEKKITSLILNSLIKASSIQDGISIGALKFTEVEIEIGVIPTVIVKFQ